MNNKKILKLTMTALMTALCYISFKYLQIKIPTPAGFTSFHLGNTFCVLAALLLGGPIGGIAGAIGMGIGDLLDPAYVIVAPKTLILKFMIGVITGFFAHKIFHIKDREGKNLVAATVASVSAGMIFNIIFEPVFSFFYYQFLLGNSTKAASYLAIGKWITTTTNGILAIVVASVLYLGIRARLKNNQALKDLAPNK